MPSKDIVIVGDAPVDVIIYPAALSSRPDRKPRDRQMLQTHRCRSGINLITRFLNCVASTHDFTVHDPLNGSQEDLRQESVRSIIEFEVYDENAIDPSTLTLKLKQIQRLDFQTSSQQPQTLTPITGSDADVLIIHDVEGCISERDEAKAFLVRARPNYILYHMTRPLASGNIWEAVRNGPVYGSGPTYNPDNLIVIVSANDLRAEGIQLSHGLSWEKTCEDFVEHLGSIGTLVSLVTCAHLIVVFSCDGVIYHRGRKTTQPVLFFDPKYTEGDFVRQNLGDVPGLLEAFVAGMAIKLVGTKVDVEECVQLGLAAARRLASYGFVVDAKTSNKPEQPIGKIMSNLSPDKNVLRFPIPSDVIGSGEEPNWSILDYTVGDPANVGREIVRDGIDLSSNWIPLAQFGRLTLVDRLEIESFRAVFNTLKEYIDGQHSRPVSIALFGPKGSGKSFASMEVGKAVLSGRAFSEFRLNLSQFSGPDDLIDTFHSIRDCNLEGSFPLIYVDGFDMSSSGSQVLWLAHLLVPILQGKFLDHGIRRPIGPAIFFLGVEKFRTYEEFRNQAPTDRKGVATASVDEFLNSLHGIVNMLGPNCIDESDRLYPVRRAILLRALLEEREPKLKIENKISIDESVLDGLLMVPSYRQGIRSLKSIIGMSRLNGCRHFERAALPPASQLDLHVEFQSFKRYMSGPILPDHIREAVAEQLHKAWQNKRLSMPLDDIERKRIMSQTWSHIGEELRESTRAHANDIPRKLRMISCFISEVQDHRVPVTEFEDDEIDLLAKDEHYRWNAERLQNQWFLGNQGSGVRTTPHLKSWEDLEPIWQNVNHAMIASYPKIIPEKYKIYRVGGVV